MVSRDTTVHAAAVVAAIFLTMAAGALADTAETGVLELAAIVLSYGLAFGGAHLYLAVRDEDGLVPTAARWRYVAVLALLLGTGAMAFHAGEITVAGVELATVVQALAVVTVVGYVVVEAVAGYRSARPDEPT